MERTEQIKHQQLVSGVSISAYWFSNFMVDFLKQLLPAIIMMLLVLAFDIEAFTESGEIYSAVCGLFLLYGWCIIPFCYLTNWLFDSYGNA